jgi:hypothetical protein
MYGMSWRIVISGEDGKTWQSIASGTREALTGASQLNVGRVVVVGSGGLASVSSVGALVLMGAVI